LGSLHSALANLTINVQLCFYSAVSTARFRGVLLRDVLAYAGLRVTSDGAVDVVAVAEADADANADANAAPVDGSVAGAVVAHTTDAVFDAARSGVVVNGDGDVDIDASVDVRHRGSVRHIQLFAADDPYDASIPVEKAMSPWGDCLLAFEMNGEPLPREHGAPLRCVVPGHLGARNVKWLSEVRAADEESYSSWQRGVPYRGYSRNVTSFAGVEPTSAPAVQELPVQSAICSPAAGATVAADAVDVDISDGVGVGGSGGGGGVGGVGGGGETVPVQGFAWSGGGRGIVRVDVSGDGGDSWVTADLKHPGQPDGREWAWTLWSADVPVPPAAPAAGDAATGAPRPVHLVCKAVDTAYNVQPESAKQLWNLRGILNNAWHRRDIVVESDE
jgi:sulfite oxidase